MSESCPIGFENTLKEQLATLNEKIASQIQQIPKTEETVARLEESLHTRLEKIRIDNDRNANPRSQQLGLLYTDQDGKPQEVPSPTEEVAPAMPERRPEEER